MLAGTLTLLIALAAIIYLRGWLHTAIPAWRAASFQLGLLATWVAVVSPISTLDDHMLTAHMIQHLLLMSIAPPLIWLGEPIRALLFSKPESSSFAIPCDFASLREFNDRLSTTLHRLGSLLAHPAFCWLFAAAVLVVWHVPALLQLGMQSPAWHLFEHASFFAAGLCFWWPVIQPWPAVARWPRWSMLLYLFLATLPCDVLSGLLVFSERVAYPVYLCTPPHAGLSALEDQQCAAALMWTCVTIVFLVAGTVLSTQLLSPAAFHHVHTPSPTAPEDLEVACV
jgi:cytochrome c oxidase assembly factor CtaG